MTLRSRLTLFFILIVVVPLSVTGFFVLHLVRGELDHRTDERLRLAARSVAALHREEAARAVTEVLRAASPIGAAMRRGGAEAAIARVRASSRLDFLVLAGRGGAIEAASLGSSRFRTSFAPRPGAIAARSAPPGVVRGSIPIAIGADRRAVLHGGWFVDDEYVRRLASVIGTPVVLSVDGTVVASSVTDPPPISPGTRGTFDVGPWRGVFAGGGGAANSIAVLVERPGQGLLWLTAVGVTALCVLIAAALGPAAARVVSDPLRRLTEGALAIAAGDLEHEVEVHGKDDVAQLGTAFNEMSRHLRGYISQLEHSRDELRHVLERMGTALGSTKDLDAVLEVVLESAVVTLGATAGAVYRIGPDGEATIRAARGFEPDASLALVPGRGIAGRVVETRLPVRTPSPWTGAPRPASPEPPAETSLAAPLMQGDSLVGVLALYDRPVAQHFTDRDLATLTSFTAQAAVAIDNVLLRKEAERMAVTDPLTGAWNRRKLEEVLVGELERAQRYGHPLSLLMIDLDHFKDVNDTFGHQVGDTVLTELARRVGASIRAHTDSLARYGGEEFVIILPETSPAGGRTVATKILDAVRSEPFGLAQTQGVWLTVSAGLATWPENGDSGEALLRAADQALYRAKRAGRDRIGLASGDGILTPTPR